MIDSNYTITLSDAIRQFREYITQNHGSDTATAQAYIRIADDLERYASEKNICALAEKAIQEYYFFSFRLFLTKCFILSRI